MNPLLPRRNLEKKKKVVEDIIRVELGNVKVNEKKAAKEEPKKEFEKESKKTKAKQNKKINSLAFFNFGQKKMSKTQNTQENYFKTCFAVFAHYSPMTCKEKI